MFVGHYILDDSVVGSVYLVSVRCEDGDAGDHFYDNYAVVAPPAAPTVIHYTLTYTYNTKPH